MTNDYNNVLLEYLTGNLSIESRSATPLYTDFDNQEYQGNLTDIGGKVVRCTDGNGNYNGKDLYYSVDNNKITLVNSEDMSIIKVFTTFSSGTALGNILALNVAEDGNIYGIDYINVGGVTTFRIILLNNISEIPKGYNDYQVILRNSYYIQGYTSDDDVSTVYEVFIKKSTQSATYYFVLRNSTGEVLMPSTFQINVGSANTWTRLQEMVTYRGDIELANIYFNENDISVADYYVVESDINDPNYVEKNITRLSAIGSGTPTYTTIISNVVATYYHANLSQVEYLGISLYESYPGHFYMCIYGAYTTNNTTYNSMAKVYYVSNGMPTLLKTYLGNYTDSQSNIKPPITFGRVTNNTLLFYLGEVTGASTAKICLDLLSPINDVDYFIDTEIEGQWNRLGIARVGIYSIYDKYIINVIYKATADDPYKIARYTMVYSDERYNGLSYIANNALSANRGMLFDSNNKLLFARGLYNKKVYNNQTMSVINVPYNMLNENIIANEKLYGETGFNLVDHTDDIMKNIYEDLYINYINAINMSNQNTDIHINNVFGASRLNKSSSKELDYNNAKASKIRVNYSDNMNYVTMASNSITNNVCTYQIGVHVPSDKEISSIEIISNDEATTYQTITGITLQNNKYYIISQDVHIE